MLRIQPPAVPQAVNRLFLFVAEKGGTVYASPFYQGAARDFFMVLPPSVAIEDSPGDPFFVELARHQAGPTASLEEFEVQPGHHHHEGCRERPDSEMCKKRERGAIARCIPPEDPPGFDPGPGFILNHHRLTAPKIIPFLEGRGTRLSPVSRRGLDSLPAGDEEYHLYTSGASGSSDSLNGRGETIAFTFRTSGDFLLPSFPLLFPESANATALVVAALGRTTLREEKEGHAKTLNPWREVRVTHETLSAFPRLHREFNRLVLTAGSTDFQKQYQQWQAEGNYLEMDRARMEEQGRYLLQDFNLDGEDWGRRWRVKVNSPTPPLPIDPVNPTPRGVEAIAHAIIEARDVEAARRLEETLKQKPIDELWTLKSHGDYRFRALLPPLLNNRGKREVGSRMVAWLKTEEDWSVKEAIHALLLKMSGREFKSYEVEKWEEWARE